MTAPAYVARRVGDAVPIGAALLSGLLTALPVAMIGAVGRERGGEEATFLHLATLSAGLALVMGLFALRGTPPALVRPLHSGASMVLLAALFTAIALLSLRGLEWYYLSTGVISVAIFLLVAWSVVRLSLGLYFTSSTLGGVLGSLVMDEIGAFGAPEHETTLLRALGVVLVAAGVVVVRAAK